MSEKHYILATAGHVDHGKSTLVKALTGTDPDRLPEEKARQITIGLGFAALRLAHPREAQTVFRIGVVDVPGHEDFVKNMVAGTGAIDAALLVVAADDGVMPQTREHVQILAYQGVRRMVVAITRSDLATPETLAAALDGVRELLRGTVFAEAALVAVSAKTGAGLAELRAALAEMFARTPPPADVGKPRLAVDRVFTVKGAGAVVTGTLSGGGLTRGQSVIVQPAGKVARIRAMQSHNLDVEHASPGMRTALNLPDLAHADLRRGDTVTLPTRGRVSSAWLVSLWRLGGAAELRDQTRVHVHHGTSDLAATVDVLRAASAEWPVMLARLRFETGGAGVFGCTGDRFVVRDWAARATLCGGVILDASPPRSRWRAREADLAARARAPDDAAAWAATALRWERAMAEPDLLHDSRFSAAEVAGAVEGLVARGRLVRLERAGQPALLVEAEWWSDLRSRAAELVDAHHAGHPEARGLPLAALRASLGRAATAALFESLVATLAPAFVRAGEVVARAGHRPALPEGLARAGATIRTALAKSPLDPPARKHLAPDAPSRAALAFLLESGEAVEISPEIVLSAEAVDRAAHVVRAHLRQHGRATVSELKMALASNRRIMVPLVEYFDRRKITRRQGDYRVLHEG
ncbi:MAG TPA: selenocysteine-specific translation elongation factor [Phycisphaerae bacterium]|nr:selenocysteine-specific translation elongation factor [Phycisphaerae bacterium]